MQKKSIVIMIIITAILGLVVPSTITGAAVLTSQNQITNEVMPLTSGERLMSDNVIFKVNALKKPILGEEDIIMIDIENKEGKVCLKEILIDGKTTWNDTHCINKTNMMNIKYTPNKSGDYIITINYEKNGLTRMPLQFKINIEPVKKTNSLTADITINNELINNLITIDKSKEKNISLSITGKNFLNITRGVLLVTIDGEHFVYEASINKVIPPLINIKKEETIMIPPLASGEYTVKGYLYIANQNNEEAITKEIKMIIN